MDKKLQVYFDRDIKDALDSLRDTSGIVLTHFCRDCVLSALGQPSSRFPEGSLPVAGSAQWRATLSECSLFVPSHGERRPPGRPPSGRSSSPSSLYFDKELMLLLSEYCEERGMPLSRFVNSSLRVALFSKGLLKSKAKRIEEGMRQFDKGLNKSI